MRPALAALQHSVLPTWDTPLLACSCTAVPLPLPTLPAHLLAAQHDPQHVGAHDLGQLLVITLRQGAVAVGVGARVVDPVAGSGFGAAV